MNLRKSKTCAVFGGSKSTVHTLDHLVALFPSHRASGVLEPQKPFSLTRRVGTLGPITVLDLEFGADTWITCGDQRPYYQVNVLVAGGMSLLHRGSAIASAPGLATVVLPEGALAVTKWSAGTRFLAFRVERCAIEDALSEAIGRELTTQIDFQPAMATTRAAGRTWLRMFSALVQEMFQPDSSLNQPLVAAPYVHSLIHATLFAADHSHRALLGSPANHIAPQAIRAAVDIMEAEPHLPLSVASLARRCGVSSRTLQQNFARDMGLTPMAYLRQVRLRRAHQELLISDFSVETVASIAKRWGYTNAGRFAAAHLARYGEAPAQTLRRISLNWHSTGRRLRPP